MSEVRCDETERGVLLSNGLISVEVQLNKGTYEVRGTTPGGPSVTSAAATIVLRDGPTLSTRGEDLEFAGTKEVADTHGKGISLLLSREAAETEPEVHVLITLYEGQPFIVVQAEIQNTGPSPLRVQELRPMDGAKLGMEAGSLRFYKHGWQSWSPTLVLDTSGVDVVTAPPVIGPGTQPECAYGRFLSEQVTAVVDPPTNAGVVLGFISAAEQFSQVWFDRNASSLTAASYADGIEVNPRGLLASEPLYIELTGDPVRSLTTFGDVVAAEIGADPLEEVPSGWCSWYYYWQGVSEAEMIANLKHIAANREVLPFDYVQLDDGYQSEIGDWLTPNDKFPSGMKWLADEIHARGFKAGIWLAPFLAGQKSVLFRDHPEWFVQSPSGGPALAIQNWGQDCYALDLTNPAVIACILDVFRTICEEWGYDYVKIDFIYAGAIDGVRHDPKVTRAKAYRRGLETIREAVGDRFILGCGNPQGASVGVVDGARVGPDIAPYWQPFDRRQPDFILSDPATINGIRNSINRYWMHGRLWLNDPDCLLVRESETALSGDEIRSLAAVIAMTGGMVLSSDNLPKLSPERQHIVSKLLPVYGKAAIPLDLFQAEDIPQALYLDCGTHRLLALFNWADTEDLIAAKLPAGEWHAFEFWEHTYAGVIADDLEATVPARGCRLFRLTPVLGHPQVIGSTLHVMQGALEIVEEAWDGKTLTVVLNPVACPDGALYVWKDGAVLEVLVTGLRGPRTIEI